MAQMTNQMTVGTGLFEIVPDLSGFQSRLSGMLSRISGSMTTGALVGVGAAIAAPVIGILGSIAGVKDRAESLLMIGEKLGVPIETMSELDYVAKQVNISITDVANAMRFMQRNLFAAAGGSEAQSRIFAALGLDAKRLVDMRPEEALKNIADAMRGIENPTVRSAVAMQVFGRGGMNIIPMLKLSREEFNRLTNEAHELGVVVSGEASDSLQAYDSAMKRLSASFEGLKILAATELAPVLAGLADKIKGFLVGFRSWLEEHRSAITVIAEAVKKIAVVVAVIGAVKGILVLLGAMLSPLGLIIGAFAFMAESSGLVDLGIRRAIKSTEILGLAWMEWMELFWDGWVNLVNRIAAYFVGKMSDALETISVWMDRAAVFWLALASGKNPYAAMQKVDDARAGRKTDWLAKKAESAADYLRGTANVYGEKFADLWAKIELPKAPEFKPRDLSTGLAKMDLGEGLAKRLETVGAQGAYAYQAAYAIDQRTTTTTVQDQLADIKDLLKQIAVNTDDPMAVVV